MRINKELDASVYIFCPEKLNVPGVKIENFEIHNQLVDCSDLSKDALSMKNIHNAKKIIVMISGLYIENDDCIKLLNVSSMVTQIELELVFKGAVKMRGKFMVRDFILKPNDYKLMSFKLDAVNAGEVKINF